MENLRKKKGYFLINKKMYTMYEGINIIGRVKEAAVIIKDTSVSHQQAILVITDTDHYLSDINSSNGTFVDGKKLVPFILYKVDDGAVVKFSTVNAKYFFMNGDKMNLENTQSQLVDESMFSSETQIVDNITINEQNKSSVSECVQQEQQCEPNYYVSDDIDLLTTEVSTHFVHELPTENTVSTIELPTVEQVVISVNDLPTQMVDSSHNDKECGLLPKDTSISNSVSIHDMPTQQFCDMVDHNELNIHKNETKQSTEFCINDAPTQITNLNNSNYESEMCKNKSISDSLNVIDETILDESTTVKPGKPSEPEIANEDSADSIDFMTMQPTSQYYANNVDSDSQELHTSQLIKKKCNVIESDNETDVEDNSEHKKLVNSEHVDSESQVHICLVKKRKRNIITSDEDISDEELNDDSIKKKKKSDDSSSDDTDLENETKRGSNKQTDTKNDEQTNDETSADETDIEAENSSTFVMKEKATFSNNLKNSESHIDESGSDTDVDLGDGKIDKRKECEDRLNVTNNLNNTDCIPSTQHCFEGEIDFDFNTQDFISKENKHENRHNTNNTTKDADNVKNDKLKKEDPKLMHDVTTIQSTKISEQDNVEFNITSKCELDLTEKLNNSDLIPATPDCFKDDIKINFNTQDIIMANSKNLSNKNTNNELQKSQNSDKLANVTNSEDALSESFKLALTCSMDCNTNTEKGIESNLDNGHILKTSKCDVSNKDGVFLEPTKKLIPPEDLKQAKSGEEILEKNIANRDDDSLFLQPTQKQFHTSNIGDDDIFLQPTQKSLITVISEAKYSEENSELRSEMTNKNNEDIFLEPTQRIIDNDDIFFQPTQKLTVNSFSKYQENAVNTTSKVFHSNDVQNRTCVSVTKQETVDDDDDIFMQLTQKLEVIKETSGRENVKEVDTNVNVFLAPIQKTVRLRVNADYKSIENTDSIINEDEDVFLAPTQQMEYLPVRADGKSIKNRDSPLQSCNDVFLLPTQKVAIENNETQSVEEKLADIFRPTQTDDAISKIDNINDDMFLLATQRVDLESTNEEATTSSIDDQKMSDHVESKLEVLFASQNVKLSEVNDRESATSRTDDQKTIDHVESQLEVLFASQNVKLSEHNDSRPPNPLINVLKDETTETNTVETLTKNKLLSGQEFKLPSNETNVTKDELKTPKNNVTNINLQPTRKSARNSKLNEETIRRTVLGNNKGKTKIYSTVISHEHNSNLQPGNQSEKPIDDVSTLEESKSNIRRSKRKPAAGKSNNKIENSGEYNLKKLGIVESSVNELEIASTSNKYKSTSECKKAEISCKDVEELDKSVNFMKSKNIYTKEDKDAPGHVLEQDEVNKGFNVAKTRSKKSKNTIIKKTVKTKQVNLEETTDSDMLTIKSNFENDNIKHKHSNRIEAHENTSNIQADIEEDTDKVATIKPIKNDNNTNNETTDKIIENEATSNRTTNKKNKSIAIKKTLQKKQIVLHEEDTDDDIINKSKNEHDNTNKEYLGKPAEKGTTSHRTRSMLRNNKTGVEKCQDKEIATSLTPTPRANTRNKRSKITIDSLNILEDSPCPSTSISVEPALKKRRTRNISTTSDDDFIPQISRITGNEGETSASRVPGAPVKTKKLQESLISPERNKLIVKHKVVFTMLDSPELESVIRSLGGSVVDSVDACTVLLTGSVKRSLKLLSAVGQGKPICSPKWVLECKKSSKFLDPWDFILTDDEAEAKWKFSLNESLHRSLNTKLMVDHTFLLLVSNAQDVLRAAIGACGGKSVTRAPPKTSTSKLVIVANPENKSKYTRFLKQNPPPVIVTSEAIFDGVLRQELHFENHLLS